MRTEHYVWEDSPKIPIDTAKVLHGARLLCRKHGLFQILKVRGDAAQLACGCWRALSQPAKVKHESWSPGGRIQKAPGTARARANRESVRAAIPVRDILASNQPSAAAS
jgi:hypothetical protein